MSQQNKIIAAFSLLLVFGFFAKLAAATPKTGVLTKPLTADIVSSAISQNPEAASRMEIPEEDADHKAKTKSVPEDLKVEAALVVKTKSNEKLLSYNEEKRWPLASLSKVMTAVVAIENFDPKANIEISENAVATEGTAGGLKPGERYAVKDLISAMMVVSSNDAAVALSESVPEGEFVRIMNEKAKSLGMDNTYFREPTGLSSLNQSTLSDMLLLVRYAWLNYPELFSVSHKSKIYITELTAKKKQLLTNINPLVANADFVGGKTGFTEDARQNLISLFTLHNESVILMIFGAEDRLAETEKIIRFLKKK